MNPSAFPSPGVVMTDGRQQGCYEGMTLRDYFAAAAMQGLLANPKLADEIKKQGGAHSGWIERSSYSWADSMLKERERGE